MMETKVLDIIIAFVKGIKDHPKENKNAPHHYINDGTNTLWNANYLLNQILRQYRINPDHIFVSVAADKRWRELTEKEMKDYNYTMEVPLKNDAELELYKGAEKNHHKVNMAKGHKFKFREIFHDEHIIPISMIIKKLIDLEELNYNNVQEILNNLYICRILKSESKIIDKNNKTDRDWNVNTTVKELFKNECGIELIGWKYD